MSQLYFKQALLADGWASDVAVDVAGDGLIQSVTPNTAIKNAGGIAVPGIPNLHSHAFQRAMAGLTERAGPADDTFWTWREIMYRFAARIGPEELEAVAAQLYVEMLKGGYTSVGEFHYLHHAPGGVPYAQAGEMSGRVIGAAQRAGIAITHLPVLYRYGGFGEAPTNKDQARFICSAEDFLSLVSDLVSGYAGAPNIRIGIAPHSLRAVSESLLSEVLAGASAIDGSAPVHIHIAEQQKEVDDCLAWSGARPVAWLLDRFEVGTRWCLVHATHMDDGETAALAKSGAVAGICPTTEANLGDGLFPARAYLDRGGALGVGSDSNVTVNAAEELRLFEYGQRLSRKERNVLGEGPGSSTGRAFFDRAAKGGAQALGLKAGAIAPGARADIVVLDADHPALAGKEGDDALDAWIFASMGSPVRDVYVGGRKVISEGAHAEEEKIAQDFRKVMKRLV